MVPLILLLVSLLSVDPVDPLDQVPAHGALRSSDPAHGALWPSDPAHRALRTRRGLLELAGAIRCSTGRSALAYVMYGCYCGLGGRGWPRDQADWCCHRHDCCYGDAERLGCQTKTRQYRWTCEDQEAECDDLEHHCEQKLCRCDREAAKCLRKSPFQRRFSVWPDFLCGSEEPRCSTD